MTRTALETLRNGDTIIIDVEAEGYQVEVSPTYGVVLVGCDCASGTSLAEVKKIYEALGAYLQLHDKENTE